MKLISFAYDFASYLMEDIDKLKINRIILFGSVVRGNADKNSDVDIFIETTEDIQGKVNDIINNFYNSVKYTKYWKLLNVKNQLKIICGNLDNFPDLKRSIISNSILLYSKFFDKIEGNNFSLFVLEFSGKFKDKVSIWRKLYGNKQIVNNKTYISKGLIEINKGMKIAKGVFVIPMENSNQIINELRKLKVKHKVFEISSDML